MKVVYNATFGGFCLSRAAIDWLGARGLQVDAYAVDVARHDPLLVECVETLGEGANNSMFADLRIATVGDVYRIDEYDGRETVQEPDDVDWVFEPASDAAEDRCPCCGKLPL